MLIQNAGKVYNFDSTKSDETEKSRFKPDLIEPIGQGGFAKLFKAKFHGDFVAMKYIPLDKVKDGYEYDKNSYGFHEYQNQETARAITFEKNQIHDNLSLISF